jgi:hypothetical protein
MRRFTLIKTLAKHRGNCCGVWQKKHWKPSASSVTFDSYYIAKKSPYPGLHPGDIERVYNIAGFLPTLMSFLGARCGHLRSCQLQTTASIASIKLVLFYPLNLGSRQVRNTQRQSFAQLLQDNLTTHERPAMQPEQFDAAFVLEDPATESVPNPPVRIARIRIIFRLPPHLNHSESPHPLAFVEWYTHMGPIDPTTQMHHVSRATRNQQPHSAVICITQVLRGCHLIPHFPRNIGREWTHENSLDVGACFFVNPYINVSTFVASKNI